MSIFFILIIVSGGTVGQDSFFMYTSNHKPESQPFWNTEVINFHYTIWFTTPYSVMWNTCLFYKCRSVQLTIWFFDYFSVFLNTCRVGWICPPHWPAPPTSLTEQFITIMVTVTMCSHTTLNTTVGKTS